MVTARLNVNQYYRTLQLLQDIHKRQQQENPPQKEKVNDDKPEK
jgi:hypothetical protein